MSGWWIRRHTGWIAWLCILTVGGGLFLFRQTNQAAQNSIRHACGPEGWQTSIALNRSRPEIVLTTLRSREPLSHSRGSHCVDLSFGCLMDGPYLGIQIVPTGPKITHVGPLAVDRIGEAVKISVAGLFSQSGDSVRLQERNAIEVLVSVLDDSFSLSAPIEFEDGESGVARFLTFDYFQAIRPVLIACKMRFLRSVKDHTEPGYDPD